jgi:hypothetical protein
MTPEVAPRTRAQSLLDLYVLALAVAMLGFGLWQWAVILGAAQGSAGPFEQMSPAWAAVTIHFAVVDPIAAVGLWLKVAGGRVLWVYAAVFETVLHTVFIGTFGANIPVVAFHLTALAVFVVLTIAAGRSRPRG